MKTTTTAGSSVAITLGIVLMALSLVLLPTVSVFGDPPCDPSNPQDPNCFANGSCDCNCDSGCAARTYPNCDTGTGKSKCDVAGGNCAGCGCRQEMTFKKCECKGEGL